MRVLSLVLLAAALTLSPVSCFADLSSFLKSCRARLIRQGLEQTAVDYSNRKLVLHDLKRGTDIKLSLGKQVGFGGWGSVYRVEDVSGAEGLPDWGRQDEKPSTKVAKFPHSIGFLYTDKPLKMTEREMRLEEASYSAVVNPLTIARIENSPLFPKTSAWRRGTLPVLPMKAYETNKGTIIFKSEVTGRTLTSLLPSDALTVDAVQKALTPEMIDSLHDIYELARTIYREVKKIEVDNSSAISTSSTEGFFPDIHRTNLVWIERPGDLKYFGLSRPSFILIELTPLHEGVTPKYVPLPERSQPLRRFATPE